MSVADLLAADRFAAGLGARLRDADEDHVGVELAVRSHHRDRLGRVSTGVLFSLADCALSLISNASGPAVAVATHLTRSGDGTDVTVLRADIRPLTDPSGEAVTFHAGLTADGEPIATFTGTTLKK